MLYKDGSKKHWEVVCQVADGAGAPHVVMRGEDGRTKLVPTSDLGVAGKMELVAAQPYESELGAAIAETGQHIRHVSNIRFLALPIFFTAWGVLASAYLPVVALTKTCANPVAADLLWDCHELAADPRHIIPYIGFWLAIAYTIFEAVLSWNLIAWWTIVGMKSKSTPWAMTTIHRNQWTLWPVRLALFAAYPTAAAMWLTYLPWTLAQWRVLFALGLTAACLVFWGWASYHKTFWQRRAAAL